VDRPRRDVRRRRGVGERDSVDRQVQLGGLDKERDATGELLLTTDFDAWSNGETFGPTALVNAVATKSTLRLERDAPVVSTGRLANTAAN
jgi:hypothetical protein